MRRILTILCLLLMPMTCLGIYTNSDNRVICRIVPQGTNAAGVVGDFTSLQSWYDLWAKKHTNASQWAECYAGGVGLGTFTPTPPTPASNTPTATAFMRIYAPPSEQFDGNGNGGAIIICSAANGLLLGNSVAYTRVEGIKFVLAGSGQVGAGFGAGNLFDRIWVVRMSDNNATVNQCFSCNLPTNPYPAYVVLRNIVYQGNGYKESSQYIETLQAGIIRVQNNAGISNTIPLYGTAIVQNVTIDGVSTNWSSISLSCGRSPAGSPTGSYITVYMDNVVETRHADTNHVFVATNIRTNNPACTLTVYQNNCYTTDSTATNWYVYAGTTYGTNVPGVTINIANSYGNSIFTDCFTTNGFPNLTWNSTLLNRGATNVNALMQSLFPDYDFSKDILGKPRKWGTIDIGGIERSIRGAIQ